MGRVARHFMTGLGALLLIVLSLNCYAMDYPDEIEMKTLAELYQGVVFNHDMHVMIAGDCATCHHHTLGTPPVDTYCARCHDGSQEVAAVSCQDCHTRERITAGTLREVERENPFHDDMPDLKGAYHLSCIGCHRELGAPVGCQDCHALAEDGEKFYHSGEYAPDSPAGQGSGH